MRVVVGTQVVNSGREEKRVFEKGIYIVFHQATDRAMDSATDKICLSVAGKVSRHVKVQCMQTGSSILPETVVGKQLDQGKMATGRSIASAALRAMWHVIRLRE